MISSTDLQERMTELIRRTVCTLPENSKRALSRAYALEEEGSVGQAHLMTTLKNLALSEKYDIPLCADTGLPVFFLRVGHGCYDLPLIEEALTASVREATKKGYIRPNAVTPMGRKNPGDNCGRHSPVFEWRVDGDIDYIEISYVPKGGGTEIFGPSFRTILVADGLAGVKRFVYDSIVVNGNRTGETCPPNVIGVGIGGTSELCMALSKQAACLRPIGSRHPDPHLAALEQELYEVLNESGLGPLGMGGRTTVLDVHVEWAMTHLVGTLVAVSAQCPAARIGTIRLYEDGHMEEVSWPGWFAY